MIYFRKYDDREGALFGALDDRDEHGILGMIKDGYTAQYYEDSVLVQELLDLPIDSLNFEHALALACIDLNNELSKLIDTIDTEDGDVYKYLENEIERKVYFALLDWGDGINPGEALMFNHAGSNVNIEYKEGWER